MQSTKKYKVALMGSKPLSIRVLRFLAKQDYVDFVGVVPVIYKSLYRKESLKEEAIKLGISILKEEDLLKHSIDLILSVNWNKLVKEPLLSHPSIGIINVHHSYKLKYRGRYSATLAILNARKKNEWFYGTTLHFIDKELDKGSIIATRSCEIKETDTAKDIYEKADNLALDLIKEYLHKILEGNVELSDPDPNSEYNDANSYQIDNKEVGLSWNPDEIYDFVRAHTFPPFEGPYIKVGKKKIYLSIKGTENE